MRLGVAHRTKEGDLEHVDDIACDHRNPVGPHPRPVILDGNNSAGDHHALLVPRCGRLVRFPVGACLGVDALDGDVWLHPVLPPVAHVDLDVAGEAVRLGADAVGGDASEGDDRGLYRGEGGGRGIRQGKGVDLRHTKCQDAAGENRGKCNRLTLSASMKKS